jgi:hypothetical protein
MSITVNRFGQICEFTFDPEINQSKTIDTDGPRLISNFCEISQHEQGPRHPSWWSGVLGDWHLAYPQV